MLSLQSSRTRNHLTSNTTPVQGRVPADRVKSILLEIAYAMHTTRVVGWKGGIAPKKG